MQILVNRDSVSTATLNSIRWVFRAAFILAAALALTASAVAQGTTPPLLPPMTQGNYIITDLGVLATLADTDSNALAINNSGSIVGYSGVYDQGLGLLKEDAFLWTPSPTDPTTGTMAYLSGLPGNTCQVQQYIDPYTGGVQVAGTDTNETEADDINSSGQVVGVSWATGDGICNHGTDHGFLYTNGKYFDFGLPLGVTLLPPIDTHLDVPFGASHATAINDAGQVVGWEYGSFNGYENTPGPGPTWLYDGSFHDLGPVPFGQESAFPNRINNHGSPSEILGYSDSCTRASGPSCPAT